MLTTYHSYTYAKLLILSLVVMFWFLAALLINGALKTRGDFSVINGRVMEVGNTKIKGVRRMLMNVYYFRVENHYQLLGIPVDKNLQPILDKTFQGLEVDDEIQVTFNENSATKKVRVNQVVKEIVRNGKVVYNILPKSYWNGKMILGVILFMLGLISLMVLIVLHRKHNRIVQARQ